MATMHKMHGTLPVIALCAAIFAALAPATTANAQLDKLLEAAKDAVGSSASASDGEIGGGLKDALAQGVESAVNRLGKTDGFLGDKAVRIPLPKSMQTVEKGLRIMGKGQVADDFIASMNRAAEQAVPEASSVLGDAIRAMTVKDAQAILSGPDDAATQYFRKVGGDKLFDRLLPIVRRSTDSAGVTSAYKGMLAKAGPAAQLVKSDATDLDGYVTKGALDGLFKMIAAEEARIRTNPAARGAALMKKVFAR